MCQVNDLPTQWKPLGESEGDSTSGTRTSDATAGAAILSAAAANPSHFQRLFSKTVGGDWKSGWEWFFNKLRHLSRAESSPFENGRLAET